MADIILKDLYGNDQIYEGVEKVKLRTADGGTQIFSIGEGGGEGGDEGKFETDIFSLKAVSGFEKFTSGVFSAQLPNNISINADKTYYVEWDGEPYTCKGIASSNASGSTNYVFLGNGSYFGWEGDNNVPFMIMTTIGSDNVLVVAYDDISKTHRIRIYQKSTLPLGYELKEIVPKTTLTFEKGNSEMMPNTPAVMLATATEVANMNVINNGESGLVIWDGQLYAVYAGQRYTSRIQFPYGTTTMSVDGSVGNIGIPSKWLKGTVVEETKSCGESNEPFLIIANTLYGFQVAIPEDSEVLTHTLQMFKFVK